jgi:hypothetical protein
MMPLAYPRRLALCLLRLGISIAPHDTLDWGHGMLSELSHVEGNWSALLWALGGAGVLAKQALVAVIFPNANRPTVPTGDLFAKESPMRRTALAVIASCIVASLLFFCAPIFRRAFAVSLGQWHHVLHTDFFAPTPYPVALAHKVEQNRDAEGLAFVAIRHPNPSESVRLAEEAVQLDPSLTWVYAVIAVQYSSFPQFDRWVSELEKYDPQNALPHFIVAEKIDIDEVVHKTIPPAFIKGITSGTEDHESPAWQNAMAAAFQSPKLDTYLDRLRELDRKVLLRYHVDDPFQALSDDSWGYWWYGLPSYSAWDSSRYAKSILESGEALEARGDRQGAIEKYLAVARFGQMMGPAGYIWVQSVHQQAYKRLASLSENSANKGRAELYASLADQADQAQKAELSSLRYRARGDVVSQWNAQISKASGLLLLFSGVLLLTCALAVIVRKRSLRLSSLHPSHLTLSLGMGGAIGSLLGSVMLYVSYRPYAEILQRFIRTGDYSRFPQLAEFLAETKVPLGTHNFYQARDFAFYFWFAVVVLCLAGLLFVVWRFQHRSRASATT